VITSIDNQRALAAAKFCPLPQYLIPYNVNETIIDQLVGNDRFPFTYPLITDWIVYKDGEHHIKPSPLKSFLVRDLRVYSDENGYFHVELTDYDDHSMTVNYSTVTDTGIRSGSLIFIDESMEVVHVDYLEGVDLSVSLSARCPDCGSELIRVSEDLTQCSNMYCPSRLRSQIMRMINLLCMDEPESELLSDILNNHKHPDRVPLLSDIFDYGKYVDAHPSVTIISVLSALVPVSIVRNIIVFKEFNLACGGSMTQILHYLEHPHEILNNLGMHDPDIISFIGWLDDPNNQITIHNTLLHVDIRKLSEHSNRAPIFRGKHIAITGEFIRGSQCDIADVFEEYGATVTVTLESDTQAVVVGSQFNGIDGNLINEAKLRNIAIFEENNFFKQYEIDGDLSKV